MHAPRDGVQRLQEGKREMPLHPKVMNINRELSDEDNLEEEERCCCIGSRNNGRNLKIIHSISPVHCLYSPGISHLECIEQQQLIFCIYLTVHTAP